MSPKKAKPQLKAFGLKQVNKKMYLFQDHNPQGYDFCGKRTDSGFYTNDIRGGCPHCMNVYLRTRSVPKLHSKRFKKLECDALVKAMLPYPHAYKEQQVFHFHSDRLVLPALWLRTLERMSSPLYSQVMQARETNITYLKRAMSITNIQPLVIYGITEITLGMIQELLQDLKTYPRTLILFSDIDIDGYPQGETTIMERTNLADLVLLPMEHIGVRALDRLVTQEG